MQLNEMNGDPKVLLDIYNRIGRATGGKGLPLGTFTGEFLRQRAGLSDEEVSLALRAGLLQQKNGGMEVNKEVAQEIGKQFNFNPVVPSWAQQ